MNIRAHGWKLGAAGMQGLVSNGRMPFPTQCRRTSAGRAMGVGHLLLAGDSRHHLRLYAAVVLPPEDLEEP